MLIQCVSPQSYCQPASTLCDVDPVCVPTELLSTCLNPVWCWPSVCPHRAIVNLPQPCVMLIQCVSPQSYCQPASPSVMLIQCVSPQSYCQPASTQCDVNPVCVPTELLSTCLNPVWCWSSVCSVLTDYVLNYIRLIHRVGRVGTYPGRPLDFSCSCFIFCSSLPDSLSVWCCKARRPSSSSWALLWAILRNQS